MGSPISAVITADALRRMTEALEALVRQDAKLRVDQANVAPLAKFVTNFNAVASLRIEEAQSGGQIFSGLTIFFFTTSGAGYYSISGGQAPSVSGPVGIEIPAGGAQIELQGFANIQAFRAIANGGTLTGAYVLFV